MENDLKNAIMLIEKKYGKGTIISLDKTDLDVDVISSGSLNLDNALGIKGLPRGRIIEIYGPESSGKTTLLISIIVEAQKLGGRCLIVDMEHTFNRGWAELMGMDASMLDIAQPSTAEEALDIMETMTRSRGYSVIGLDSVAALVPKSEDEGSMGDAIIGLQARLMSQAMRKLNTHVDKTNTMVIFINQIRMKIGVMFGNPETTSGGNALKFFSSVRLEIRKGGDIITNQEKIGFNIKAKVVKNKLAPPFNVCEIPLIFSEGISFLEEVIDVAVEKDVITKSGSWYSYNGNQIGQGRAQTKAWLKDEANKASLQEICEKIR